MTLLQAEHAFRHHPNDKHISTSLMKVELRTGFYGQEVILFFLTLMNKVLPSQLLGIYALELSCAFYVVLVLSLVHFQLNL
jgi:hypothetical protein